ncbi:MAG: hypothetical protein PVJ40_03700 [Gammaproteobacteria bacterium]|jgi:hypothetical protein
MSQHKQGSIFRIAALAGVAGGLAEVLWVALYCWQTGVSGLNIASAVGATVWPGAGASPVFGLIVHFGLSIVIAWGFAGFFWRTLFVNSGREAVLMASIALLAVIWAVNFLALLPAINPDFLVLVPLHVAMVSKLLFGVAMGLVLADPLSTRAAGWEEVPAVAHSPRIRRVA